MTDRTSTASRLEALRVETDRIAGLLASGPLDLPVPSCPGWTARDLAVHLAAVHRWAAAAVGAGGERVPPPVERTDVDVVEDYPVAAAGLIAALEATPADAPAWGFGPSPRTAAFWCRRQLHETAVHRWDLQTAHGVPVDELATGFAADGVDEVLTVFLSRRLRSGDLALPASLHLRADEGSTWQLGDARPDATIAGPAEALLLLLWGRIGPGDRRLTVAGDRATVDSVLAAASAP